MVGEFSCQPRLNSWLVAKPDKSNPVDSAWQTAPRYYVGQKKDGTAVWAHDAKLAARLRHDESGVVVVRLRSVGVEVSVTA
jgi:hypothetical protein